MKNQPKKIFSKKTLTQKVLQSYKKNFGVARCNLELLMQEHRFTCFNTSLYQGDTWMG